MTVYGRILVAGAGSAALLIAAFAFQYLGGLAPCELCVWQRWPHALAAVISVLAITVLWRQHRALAALGGATMLAGAGLAGFHAGVEQGWWEGFSACAAPAPGDLSPPELLARIREAPLVRCDEIAWQMLGVSMAGWNALASLCLAGVWLWSARRPAA